jgi:fructosamine-3-kinase
LKKYIKKFEAGAFLETWLVKKNKLFVRKQGDIKSEKQYCEDIIKGQYLWLKLALKNKLNVPKTLKKGKNDKINFYDMEYIHPSKTLSKYLNKKNKNKIYENLFYNIKKFYNKNYQIKKKNLNLYNQLYIEKIVPSIRSLKNNPLGEKILKEKYLFINGEKNLNLLDSLNSIKKKTNLYLKNINNNFDNKHKTYAHGDLTFENILVKKNKLYFIDPYGGNVDCNSKNNFFFKTTIMFDIGKICQSVISRYEDWKNIKSLKKFYDKGKITIRKMNNDDRQFLKLLNDNFGKGNKYFKKIAILHMIVHICRLIKYRSKHNFVSAVYAYFLATYWINKLIKKSDF